ncbi:hypothetical protein BRADI_3g02817v3 [Brachypodium distachyon]|uniref:GPI inositol-deacylase n=1 Tax=Brachypodium distachyon TaxID=15368 RepID=A0A2K2CUU4_BRADI|nr:hypothetical protein BRADI_3g02817v3 [Brachypodium distachyon]
MLSLLPPLRPRAAPSDAASAAPRRPVVILPGLGNNTADYARLAGALRDDHGMPAAVVARVSRPDWLRNAAGLADLSYWRGTLRPRPVLDWYLGRVEEAVAEAKELCSPDGKLSLIGHSAGGWLARVYMEEFGTSDISLLLTLGTPHLYIKGARLTGNSITTADEIVAVDTTSEAAEAVMISADNISAPPGPTFRSRFVGQGYKQVCGRADVWGDGVVPEVSAHLEGALNISFDGVYHSPVGSDDEERPWYGSPAILQQWVHHLLS